MPVLFSMTILVIIAVLVIILFPLMPKIGGMVKEWFKWEEEVDKNKTDEGENKNEI